MEPLWAPAAALIRAAAVAALSPSVALSELANVGPLPHAVAAADNSSEEQ